MAQRVARTVLRQGCLVGMAPRRSPHHWVLASSHMRQNAIQMHSERVVGSRITTQRPASTGRVVGVGVVNMTVASLFVEGFCSTVDSDANLTIGLVTSTRLRTHT
eukprot:365243-Chlamydomonas_euryale.AAC.21